MKREDISFYAGIITAVVTVIVALLALYEFLKEASEPERVISLGIIAACFLLLTLFLVERRTKVGRRLLKLAVSLSKLAIRFALQNPLFLASLATVCVLLYLVERQVQDIVIAGIATGLVLAIVCLALGTVRLLAMTRPSFLGLPVPVAPRELKLTYQGKAGDEVGPGPGRLGPDGHEDATFLLEVLWRQRRQIAQIELLRIDSEGNRLGERWTSSRHPGIWQLGVVGRTQEGTVALSRGPWTVNADEEFTFLLYASDWVPPQAWFTEGQWYEVLVHHEGGPSTVRTCLEGS